MVVRAKVPVVDDAGTTTFGGKGPAYLRRPRHDDSVGLKQGVWCLDWEFGDVILRVGVLRGNVRISKGRLAGSNEILNGFNRNFNQHREREPGILDYQVRHIIC